MTIINSLEMSGSLGLTHDKVKKTIRDLDIPYTTMKGQKYLFSREIFEEAFENSFKPRSVQNEEIANRKAYKKIKGKTPTKAKASK